VFGSFENCEPAIGPGTVTELSRDAIDHHRSAVRTRDKDAARTEVVAGVAWRPPASTGCRPVSRAYYPAAGRL